MVNIKHINPPIDLNGTVAIVGSSATLKSKNWAKEIDQHDEVIRFNRAPTENWEHVAGAKTTLRIVNNHVLMSIPFPKWKEDNNFVKKMRNSKILVTGVEPRAYANRKQYVHNSNQVSMIDHHGALKAINEFTDKLCGVKLKLPTVGTFGIMLVILSGIKPDIYGWDIAKGSPRSHYWNKRSAQSSEWHKAEPEMTIMRALANSGKIIVKL